ncbi:uncharacterized protein LOC127011631 [Drosophila biarmipes]|uniref:uncharacterized protein LOC127011631 n=1 Tax=Drosophila biarmipes TaxID=125945 RepID=UPI0021CC862F|nr:uncharacterized protein LOC127011631 [Drosophila biarmipes]
MHCMCADHKSRSVDPREREKSDTLSKVKPQLHLESRKTRSAIKILKSQHKKRRQNWLGVCTGYGQQMVTHTRRSELVPVLKATLRGDARTVNATSAFFPCGS